MIYRAKDFEHLLGLEGFSSELLHDHFLLYRGYVEATNQLDRELRVLLESGKTQEPAFAELKRRFGWEFNGMRLHEFYFGGLIQRGVKLESASDLSHRICKDFGSLGNWQRDFTATAAMRGVGWVVFVLDPLQDRMLNIWIDEHDSGHLSGSCPLLVLDVFEHAFWRDYGLRKAEYVQAFLGVVDWKTVMGRFKNTEAKSVMQ